MTWVILSLVGEFFPWKEIIIFTSGNIYFHEEKYLFSWKEFANDDYQEVNSQLSSDLPAIDYTLINTLDSESSWLR